MLKYTKFFFIIILLKVSFLVNSNAKEIKRKYIIATASSGGTFYPIGVGIATIASMQLAKKYDIIFSAATSAGSCENINLLNKEEIDFAILQSLCGSMAWQGKGKHKGNAKLNLRSISMLWQNVEQFTIRSEYASTGNIKDLKNLYGKAFSIGGRNSGSRVSAEIILKSLDIDCKLMNLEYLGYSSGGNSLVSGKIEGMNTPAGAPTSTVNNVFGALGNDKIKVLEFSHDDLKRINENYPVWSPYIIKAGTYPNQENDIHTIAQPNVLVVTKDTPDEIVYLLTKAIYENLDYLHGVHEATKAISLKKAIVGLPMPLHPGATRFYKEMGIKIPSHLMIE